MRRRLRAAGAGEPEQIPKIVRALGPAGARPARSRRRRRSSTSRRRRSRCSGRRSCARPRGCSRTIPASGSATTPKPCTRPGSRPAGSAPTCARSAVVVDPEWDASLRAELQVARRASSAPCATPTCSSNGSTAGRHELPPRTITTPGSTCSTGCASTARQRAHRAARRRCGPIATSRCSTACVAAARAVPSSVDAVRRSTSSWATSSREAVEEAARRGRGARRRSARRRAARGAHPGQALPVRGRGGRPGGRQGGQALRGAQSQALQDVLGEHQDAVVAGHWLRSACGRRRRARSSPRSSPGELAALEDVAAARLAGSSGPTAWKRARRRSLRRWM